VFFMGLRVLDRSHARKGGETVAEESGRPRRMGRMKCPTCGENTPDSWEQYQAVEPVKAGGYRTVLGLQSGAGVHESYVTLDWMHCANPECEELVIRMHEDARLRSGLETVVLRPRAAVPYAFSGGVPEDFLRDYGEAVVILQASPRMSAVLSRRILADLLERYAKLTDFSLKARIDAFVKNTSHPYDLRENLGHLVEMGNFGAHTQTNDQAEVVDVSAEEAEWTLGLVERLFDYFILTPEKDKRMREQFDKKLEEAKRKPIEPPPDADTS
jgi:hypothetical protein